MTPRQNLREYLKQQAAKEKLDPSMSTEAILAEAPQIVAQAIKRGWMKYGVELTDGQVENIARRK